jgi:hypothetical protein
MKRSSLLIGAAALLIGTGAATAQVTRNHFVLRTTGDLVALCGVSPDDPNRVAAIHFCEGYILGLDHFAEVTGRPFRGALYCPPEGLKMSRDEMVSRLVAWHRQNPGPASEGPFDGIVRWAAATWPCKK